MQDQVNITHEQYQQLVSGLKTDRVSVLNGQSYLEQWDVRRHLIRIFGFGGWDFIRLHCDLVQQIDHPPHGSSDKGRYTVVYRYEGRLIVRDRYGGAAAYDDAAVGGATNQPSLEGAHDLALKSAASGALKRCAVNLGDQFGLGLYSDEFVNKTKPRMPSLVRESLIKPPPPKVPVPPPEGEPASD